MARGELACGRRSNNTQRERIVENRRAIENLMLSAVNRNSLSGGAGTVMCHTA